MNDLILCLASVVQTGMADVTPPADTRRPSTKELYGALKTTRPLLEERFGGPVFCRYTGSPEGNKKQYGTSDERFRVLEYLWDFSLSRYAIPQATARPDASPITGGKYELLFVAESELGTEDEICRDLLKLIEARTTIRCLVYRQPKRSRRRIAFQSRMTHVLHNHRYFCEDPGLWLFAGLTWAPGHLSCDVYTLSDELDELVCVNDG